MTLPVIPDVPAQDDTPDPVVIAHRLRLRETEYAALRATIRERGTRRMTLVVASAGTWALLALLATSNFPVQPVWALLPLIVLVAGFEAGFAMHVGVERIGRYLQVEYENGPGAPGWEHAATRFGATPAPAGGRTDPLFSVVFILAAALNLLPLATSTVPDPRDDVYRLALDLALVLLAHLVFVARIIRARAYAAQQRALDLAVLSRSRGPEVP
jgi:hypothetical protein